MRRRLVGIVASVGLAVFGTAVLVGYVQSAHKKAATAEPMESVLVVTQRVPRGTKASDLEGKVTVRDVPASARAHNAVSSVDEIDGTKVATTDLLPDEQVIADRFQTPQQAGRQGVPPGLLEVTVKLAPERAVGGTVRAGDTVAVVSSFPPFDLQGPAAQAAGVTRSPNTTHVILHKVLVTNVQISSTSSDVKKTSDVKKEGDTTPDPAPKGELLVTLALDATSVQRVVFTAEYGTLWLSNEPADAPDGQTRVETVGTVN